MEQKTRRMIRIVIFGLIVGIIVLYLGLPAVMGAAAVMQGGSEVGDPPGGFREQQLVTSDNIELKAWYHPSVSSRTIIVVHGSGGSREDLRPYINLLTRHGFGVLALDLRGHGESGGQTNRFGWNSSPDIAAAVRYLQEQPEAGTIGALGLSMGGEILLGEAAANPEIKAIVVDGATRRSTQELLALDSERSLVHNFTARVMYAATELFGGDKPPQPLLESMLLADKTNFLFIAAGDEDLEVKFNQLFFDRLGSDRAVLWVAPEVDHLGALRRYSQEYENRIINFLEDSL